MYILQLKFEMHFPLMQLILETHSKYSFFKANQVPFQSQVIKKI